MVGAARRGRPGARRADPRSVPHRPLADRDGILGHAADGRRDPLLLQLPLSQGVAVDAETGETLWVFNPKSYEEGTTMMSGKWRQRGVLRASPRRFHLEDNLLVCH